MHRYKEKGFTVNTLQRLWMTSYRHNRYKRRYSWNWGCRLHWLHLYKSPRYDIKQSDGEAPVMLWGMQGTSSLPSFPGPLWPGAVARNRVLSMGQIELNCVLILDWIAWNRTVLTFKLRTYAKLNCLKWNCLTELNSLK